MAKAIRKPKTGNAVDQENPSPEVDTTDDVGTKPEPKNKNAESATLVLRKKDFVERVLQASGDVNKSHAKTVIDHTLEQILIALQKGEMLAIAPLGKVRLASTVEKDDGDRLSVRIKMISASNEKS